MLKKYKKFRDNRAIALIEFIIALPLLILILTILIESGRYFDVYFRLSNIAWNGTRFFSSLSLPAVACFQDNTVTPTNNNASIYTTNLAYWANPPSPSQVDKLATYDSHLIVHQRIRTLFWVGSDSWPIKSEQIIPDGTGTKLSDKAPNMPTIKTQYIGALVDPEGNTSSRLAEVCASPPSMNNPDERILENTVGVCLEAMFQGFIINLPIKACSYGFLLGNNESSVISTNSNAGNGNGGGGGSYNYGNNSYYSNNSGGNSGNSGNSGGNSNGNANSNW